MDRSAPASVPTPLDSPNLFSGKGNGTRTNQELLECPPLRWALIGCGRVSHDFAQALKHIPSASIVACAARDLNRAQEFATKHGIPKAYGDYDTLLQDDTIDVVYVGNVHAFRRSVGEKCILANKNVLLEKPFACTTQDAEYLIGLAKERNLFLMEGMWTRFFPAYEMARQLVMGATTVSDEGQETKVSGVIGEVVNVFSDFNFNASDSEEYPTSFFYNRKLGGGAGLLTGPYPIAAATAFYGGVEPSRVQVVGQVDRQTGVDLQAAILLEFPPTSNVSPAQDSANTTENTAKLPGAGIATLSYGLLGESEETTVVVGTKGRLTIHAPGHCPTKISVRLKDKGRGMGTVTEYNFPLPGDTPAIKEAGGFFYPNSAGFCYEGAAVARCIAAGNKEVPQYTLYETLVTMKILDKARQELGVKAVDEE